MSLARLALLSVVLTSALAWPADAASCPPGTYQMDGRCIRYAPGGSVGPGPDLTPTRGSRDDKPGNVPPLRSTTTPSGGNVVSQPKDTAVLRNTRACPPDTYRTSTGCRPLSARPRN